MIAEETDEWRGASSRIDGSPNLISDISNLSNLDQRFRAAQAPSEKRACSADVEAVDAAITPYSHSHLDFYLPLP